MINLYNKDCMEALKEYPDGYFDCAIVDPPYGIGDFSMSSNFANRKSIKNIKSGTYGWNKSIPTKEYFVQLQRVSNKQIIWGANYYNCFPKNGGAIVWYKNMGHTNLSQCEIASRSWGKKVDYLALNWQSGFMRSKSGGNWHPCPKPVALYTWLLDRYCQRGWRILDTHLGSGSIALACHDMGFALEGYEIDTEYYTAACERLRQHQRQLKLFEGV